MQKEKKIPRSGMQIGASTVESSMELHQRIKKGSAFWPSYPTSGNITKRTQNTNSKEQKHPYVSVSYNHQDMEAAQVSISRWVHKTSMVHIYNEIVVGHKKEENFTLWPGEHYAGWNKPVRERQIPYDFTHTWNLMSKLN